MRKIREILRLKHAADLSQRQIAASVGSALSTIQDCLRRAAEAGLSWPVPEELDDAQLEERLYPVRPTVTAIPQPDFAHVQRELSRAGVMRFLLWQEYKAQHPEGLQYTAFCVQYRRWLKRTAEPVMRFEHRAGEKCFVDYAGQTAEVIDRHTGEVRCAQIFVAVLGCSNYTYAEASWSQGKSLSDVDYGDVVVAGTVSAVIPGLANAAKVGFNSAKVVTQSVRAISKLSEQVAKTANRAEKLSERIGNNLRKIEGAVADAGKAAVAAAAHQGVKEAGQEAVPPMTANSPPTSRSSAPSTSAPATPNPGPLPQQPAPCGPRNTTGCGK